MVEPRTTQPIVADPKVAERKYVESVRRAFGRWVEAGKPVDRLGPVAPSASHGKVDPTPR